MTGCSTQSVNQNHLYHPFVSAAITAIFASEGIEMPTNSEEMQLALRSLAERARARADVLSQAKTVIDPDTFYDNYAIWGDFGWVIPDEMQLADIAFASNVSDSATADSLMMTHYIDDQFLQSLFRQLHDKVTRTDDIDEAIWLFELDEERHNKPCAMLLASLIDGSLIVTDRPATPSTYRRAKHSLDTMEEDAKTTKALKGMIENANHAFDYFFHNTSDFDPTKEGELSRHFLLHGMMSKPVERTTCIKLFLLLKAVVTLPTIRY